MKLSTITTANGMPLVGMGTWQLRGRACRMAIRQALEVGYRHFDTAAMYGNECDVGVALEECGIGRSEVFVTTKVWQSDFKASALLRSVESSLANLRTDYADLILLHWPSASVPIGETMGALSKVYASGRARAIGVSNFSAAQLDEARKVSDAPITHLQLKAHVGSFDRELIEFARAVGCSITAYSPLGQGGLTSSRALTAIGRQYGKTAAQVALRWLVQQGLAVIPKASSKQRLTENLDVFDFALSESDMLYLGSGAS